MYAKRGFVPLFVLVLMFWASPAAIAQPTTPALIQTTSRQGSRPFERRPTVIRHRRVLVDVALLRGPNNGRLRFPLFDGAQIQLLRDRQEKPRDNTLIWYGKVVGQPGGFAVFSVVNDVLSGQVVTQRRHRMAFYEIRYLGNGVHALVQIDQSRYPPERPPIERPPSDIASSEKEGEPTETNGEIQRDERPTCASDPPTDIDLLVLYTPAARIGAGGTTDAIEALIYEAVALTNLSYFNSDIVQRLRLVHAEEVAYTEVDDFDDLAALQDPFDGVMNHVQSVRNTYSADVVALLVEYGAEYPFCGSSYLMTQVRNDHQTDAYAVCLRDCAVGNYTLAHELGHIMAARHDWDKDPTNSSPYNFNHGYVALSQQPTLHAYQTIMATPKKCVDDGISLDQCPRIPFWSHPGKIFPPLDPNGVALGVGPGLPRRADNHETLNRTAPTVANFRCSSRGINNVWMKDTWNDTGDEPDPLTANDDMWKSPYIWVRRSEDVQLTQQHLHEEPVMGSPNWIYVKLHNGGNATNGDLEIYGSNASPGLPWPTDWTRLGTVPVTSFAKNSVRVVGLPWTPSGGGHYCLLARWVSSTDPMVSPETIDIQANVRNNNNIVWRNLFVVNLVSASTVEMAFEVRSAMDEQGATRLLIRTPVSERQSFLRHGGVTLMLDDTLMRAWRDGGRKGRGVRGEGPGFTVTEEEAFLEGLRLPRGASGRVMVKFEKQPATPAGTFVVDFVQLEQSERTTSPRVVGGVSYEIRTKPIR